MKFRCIFLLLIAMQFVFVSYAEKPVIVKHGTIDLDLVECTPVVFNDKLYRFEYVRPGYKPNKTGDSYFRFIDVETSEPTASFAKGYDLGSAFVDGDAVYVTGVNPWGDDQIDMFVSTDLISWKKRPVLKDTNYEIFNTSMCKDDKGYVLMFEIGKPQEEAGAAFTARFLTSKDLKTWTLTPAECAYAKDRYTAPHCLRYLDGDYYDFYLEAHDGYEMRVVRSKDLVHWQPSPLNPVLRHSEDDKKIANPKLTEEQRKEIAEAKNINNSDIDFCEYQGRLVISYSWGNQQGKEFLAEAHYEGSLESFLRGWFPEQ